MTFFYKLSSSFFKNKFIYLFLAALGLRCCVQAFSCRGEQGLLLAAVHEPLVVAVSLVAEPGLYACGLSSCGMQAQ